MGGQDAPPGGASVFSRDGGIIIKNRDGHLDDLVEIELSHDQEPPPAKSGSTFHLLWDLWSLG